jgi:NOL1/NOP2/sun family putative RNA methylase
MYCWLSLMSGKEFFIRRYEQLGWAYREIEAKRSIRINITNTKNIEIVKRIKSLGVKLEKIPFLKNGYWICKSRFSLGATAEYLLGLYSIQEAAAQIPVTLFNKLGNKTVLDACAPPGGKTVQLADLMLNTGMVTALGIKKRRLFSLSNQLERCRVKNTVIYQLDARKATHLTIKWDRILLDVPCSGNYVTDKSWFQRRTVKDIKRNAALQRQILAESVKVIQDNGEIVYSTCSLEPEENELNIDWAINALNLQVEEITCYGEKALTNVFGRKLDHSIAKCRRIWPNSTQGFFICKLRKRV